MVIWETLKPWTPLIRTGGNFGVTFMSSFTAFDFIYSIPAPELIMGAVGTATVTTLLAISYEARKFHVSK
jgi:hypothetical protein